MTTITIDKGINLAKTHFKDLEEFQLHLVQVKEQAKMSEAHKAILDDRLVDADNNPNDFVDLDELKSSILRK